MIDITIPMRIPLLNVWQRWHWAKRRRVGRQIAWLMREALGPNRPEWPLKRCSIRIERTSTKIPDDDALIAKPLLDALQPCSKRHPYGLGVIIDDNPACITNQEILHVAGKGERTRIVIIPEAA